MMQTVMGRKIKESQERQGKRPHPPLKPTLVKQVGVGRTARYRTQY